MRPDPADVSARTCRCASPHHELSPASSSRRLLRLRAVAAALAVGGFASLAVVLLGPPSDISDTSDPRTPRRSSRSPMRSRQDNGPTSCSGPGHEPPRSPRQHQPLGGRPRGPAAGAGARGQLRGSWRRRAGPRRPRRPRAARRRPCPRGRAAGPVARAGQRAGRPGRRSTDVRLRRDAPARRPGPDGSRRVRPRSRRRRPPARSDLRRPRAERRATGRCQQVARDPGHRAHRRPGGARPRRLRSPRGVRPDRLRRPAARDPAALPGLARGRGRERDRRAPPRGRGRAGHPRRGQRHAPRSGHRRLGRRLCAPSALRGPCRSSWAEEHPLAACVQVERVVAHETGERHTRLTGQVDGQRGRR